jgi:pimeloyl-ACP methyl ester carboxylesterase/DNA-binding SARP family transcriptional activator
MMPRTGRLNLAELSAALPPATEPSSQVRAATRCSLPAPSGDGRHVHLDHLPRTRFAPTRGARLAYQVFGDGEHTVVAIPPTAQNIELSWEQPAVRVMLERFASFCRYLHFDKRGTGCSDRSGRIADLDERVDDLRAVMDHAEIEHAHLFGNSEGGPMSLLFAATYPERVDSLILFGTGATLLPPDLGAAQLAERRAGAARYAARWGTDESPVAAGMAPTLTAEDPGFPAWHRRYERYAASQDSLLELLELSFTVDVRELVPSIHHPVLVIHRTDDRVIAVDRARELVALLPNGRLMEQPGADHFSYSGDVDGWMDEFERFVTGAVRSPRVADGRRPEVCIATLGRFVVTVDGQEVPTSAWGSRRARQLCKRLVAARGWPVTRDELFDLLWPDEADRHRLGARLSVQLSGVRRVLRGGVIADRQSVRLDLQDVDTDLERLFRASSDTDIVAAYPGVFLPDDVYESWTEGIRVEAQARFALSARREARRLLDDDQPQAAVQLALRLREVDSYDAEAHRLLATALDRVGATTEAGRARAVHRAAMAELGVPVDDPDKLR